MDVGGFLCKPSAKKDTHQQEFFEEGPGVHRSQ
jgi:hypothetical protein